MTPQQREALDYFRANADDWRSKAEGSGTARVNIIKQRNDFVLNVLEERESTRKFLDVGCGTGELVCEASRRGIDSTGVDYAAEMVQLAETKAGDEGVPDAKFVCASIFELPIEDGEFDLISANGFIEYISLEQLNSFAGLAARALAPGGSFVVGSRNRLFNVLSQNDYTLMEMQAGALDLLIRESIDLAKVTSVAELNGVEFAPIQAAETQHAKTGVDVGTRFQYTPMQLIDLLSNYGLSAAEIYPLHIHGAPPSFKSSAAEVHTSIANVLQEYARNNLRLLPHASSFMLHAVKAPQ